MSGSPQVQVIKKHKSDAHSRKLNPNLNPCPRPHLINVHKPDQLNLNLFMISCCRKVGDIFDRSGMTNQVVCGILINPLVVQNL